MNNWKRIFTSLLAAFLLTSVLMTPPAMASANAMPEISDPSLIAELIILYEDDETVEFEVVVREAPSGGISTMRYDYIFVVTGSMSVSNGNVTVNSLLTTKPGYSGTCKLTATVYRDYTAQHAYWSAEGTASGGVASAQLVKSSPLASGTHTYHAVITATAKTDTVTITTPAKTGAK